MFGKLPTTWFTRWNCYSLAMQKAADYLGIKINNESYDIAKFIREVKKGTYQGHSFYFHGWNKNERDLVPEALDIVKSLLDKEKEKE